MNGSNSCSNFGLFHVVPEIRGLNKKQKETKYRPIIEHGNGIHGRIFHIAMFDDRRISCF
jgi:hypothetical protein